MGKETKKKSDLDNSKVYTFVKCSACDGRGYVYRSSTTLDSSEGTSPCEVCKGTAIVKAYFQKQSDANQSHDA